MAPVPDPIVDDEVRDKLKSAMEETGAPAELVEAVSTAEVPAPPEPAQGDSAPGKPGKPAAARRRNRSRLRRG